MYTKEYDVFISHATADKKLYVNKLVKEIKRTGLVTFYDVDSIDWGDSIKDKIDEGLKLCRRAVVVVSNSYFGREWTEYELNELMKRQDKEGHKLIMPILYQVTKKDLVAHYPFMEDIKFIHARDYSYKEIAEKICKDILRNG